jgi:hypothetical protein
VIPQRITPGSKMLMRIVCLALVASASALRAPVASSSQHTAAKVTRRSALVSIGGMFAAMSSPSSTHAEGTGTISNTCLGFGCNDYGRPDFNGMPDEEASPGSMPYPDFLEALRAKKVEGVVFKPPSGDEAYAIIGGKSVRMGAGWPVEVSNSWSSPTWVVRILENEGVPYAWDFNLKAKPRVRSEPPARYVPKESSAYDPAQTWTAPSGPAPKMYGGA